MGVACYFLRYRCLYFEIQKFFINLLLFDWIYDVLYTQTKIREEERNVRPCNILRR